MDVIVIGAGILGTFHAYFAALRGCKVTLIERNAAPNDSSVRNFGMIATGSIASPGEWDDYAQASNDIYRQLDDSIDADITLRRNGSLYLVSTTWEDRIIKEFAQLREDRARYLTAEEIRKQYPYASEDYVRSGLYFDNDMSIDPTKLIHVLLREFVARKRFRYLPNRTVVSVRSTGHGCIVHDANGNEFTAEKVIICSGIEYRLIFPQFFKSSGLQLCKVHMMKTVPQRQKLKCNVLSGLSLYRYPAYHICPSYNLFKSNFKDDVYKKWGIHLLFKQADDGGVIIGDSHEYYSLDGSEAIDYRERSEVRDAILKYAGRMMKLDFRLDHSWLGYYMNHPEKEIINEQLEENVFAAVGIAGKGMTTGPGFARANIDRIINSN